MESPESPIKMDDLGGKKTLFLETPIGLFLYIYVQFQGGKSEVPCWIWIFTFQDSNSKTRHEKPVQNPTYPVGYVNFILGLPTGLPTWIAKNMDCQKKTYFSKKFRKHLQHIVEKSRLLHLGQNQDALSLWCFPSPQLAFQCVTIFIANGVGIEAELRRHPNGYVLQSMSMVVWWGDHTINHLENLSTILPT